VKALVLGVGNRMRGDDAVGSIIGELLAAGGRIPAIDCSVAPENHLSRILEARPEELILVDACDFGGRAGEIRRFEEAEFEKIAHGLLLTHTLPLTLLATLVKKEIDCRIQLIGIQPQGVEFAAEMSAAVRAAIPNVVALVEKSAGDQTAGKIDKFRRGRNRRSRPVQTRAQV